MSNIRLKPIQIEGVKLLLRNKCQGLNYSTGAGKTIIFLEGIRQLIRHNAIDYIFIFHEKSGYKTIVDDNKYYQFEFNVVKNTDIVCKAPIVNLIQYNVFKDVQRTVFNKVYTDSRTVIVLDECTYIRNRKSRTRKLFDVLRSQVNYVWALTATPMGNRLEDMYSLTEYIKPGFFGPFNMFRRVYCTLKQRSVWRKGRQIRFSEITGYRNLDILNANINLVWDIQTEHMPIEYRYIDLGNLPPDDEWQYFKEAKGIIEDTPNLKEFAARLPGLQRITDISNRKINIVARNLTRMYQNGVGCIVYFVLKDPLFKLRELLPFHVDVITGSTSLKERCRIRDAFKEDSILLCSSAASKSLNLHAVNRVMFYTTPFEIQTFGQVIGRAARPFVSKYDKIIVYMPFMKNTVDEYRIKMMHDNAALVNAVLGGNDPNIPKQIGDLKRSTLINLRKSLLWRK